MTNVGFCGSGTNPIGRGGLNPAIRRNMIRFSATVPRNDGLPCDLSGDDVPKRPSSSRYFGRTHRWRETASSRRSPGKQVPLLEAAPFTVYDLDATDGSLRWKHVICGNPEEANCELDQKDPTQIFSSPAVFGGLIFLGHTAGADGYRGAIEALDARSGTQRWRFEVDPILDANGHSIRDRRGHSHFQLSGLGCLFSAPLG